MNITMKRMLSVALVMVMAFSAAAYADMENYIDLDALVEKKMSESGATTDDIIAGIDPSSVTTQGEDTCFTSMMSDGTAVRFVGHNIAIGEDGLTLYPDGSVVSLDAVGKIYRYDASFKDADQAPVCDQTLNVGYGYTFSSEKTSVTQAEELFTGEISGYAAVVWQSEANISTVLFEPNFVYFNAWTYNTEAITLTSLTIDYNPAEKVTALTEAKLYPYYYGYYADGAPYNAAKEDKADSVNWIYDFYLLLKTEAMEEVGVTQSHRWIGFLPRQFYAVGDLKDADGNVLDKASARVHAGYTLDLTVGDSQLVLELPMVERFEGAQTLKEARPYSTLSAVGVQHALVVPVVWADQTDLVSDETYALYQKALGRLMDEQGESLADYSVADDGVFSLTEYFDIASYGRLELSSFLTDWYYTDKNFANDYEYAFPEINFADEVLQWVKTTYPDTDWTQFDQDGDGIVDAMVLLSVGLTQNEGYAPSSFGGAVHSTGSDFGEFAGTQADPQANCFLTVNHFFLKDGEINTLIHEFSHNFGLNDYYDGLGYGINAVGGYDMQGDSVGDWNAYSKLAVGWMQPQVVSGLSSGESVELTIGSSALTGDVILLPAAGTEYDGPFGEYVMIDLLTPDGANLYDAPKYGLEDTVGVRISHVDAILRRTTQGDRYLGYEGPEDIVIGTELYGNHYQEGGLGFYNIEVIQAGGENTFTDMDRLYPTLQAEDLFRAGDTFAAEEYDQFFYQGLMDNGMPLGYTVDILGIAADANGQPTATIRITAQ